MGVIAKEILRGCQDLFTPVSLGYPLSGFNKKLYSQTQRKKGVIAKWPNTRIVKCEYDVSQKHMGSIIRSTRTVFYSLSYSNSRQGFNGLKYLCPVI